MVLRVKNGTAKDVIDKHPLLKPTNFHQFILLNQKMNSINNISRRLNSLTQENLLTTNRVLDFHTSNNGIWKGSKRFAH
jgi:hypothetical protein